MDVVVIDVLDVWGMLLFRKWTATLGGSIQMDSSYASILANDRTFVTMYKKPIVKYQANDPSVPLNELECSDDKFQELEILTNSLMLREEYHCRKPYEDVEKPIIPSLVSANLDYSQDFAILPFAIDDVFTPKNEDDRQAYAMVQPKSQECDTNPKGKALAKVFNEGSRKDPGLHKND